LNSGAPRLLVITDRRATAGRPLADVVAAALRGVAGTGLAPADVAVQLREKDLEGAALAALARALRDATRAAGVALWINDRPDVALAVGADGVHLGGTALAPADVARLVPASALAIAVSAHRPEDLDAARASMSGSMSDRLAFALYGPIHDTPSKRPYGPPVGLPSLAAAAGRGVPLVAVGGIGPGEVAAALAAGARGVACIRAIMGAPDPASALSAFCQELTSAAATRPSPGRNT
jgi:thiamine-phosphate pyrophosphorylase